MAEALSLVWPLALGVFTFVFGKMFGQSEKILDQKRKAYEAFLEVCPAPNEAHIEDSFNAVETQRATGILTVYGSMEALQFAGEYFNTFANAQPVLVEIDQPGHPEYLKVMTAYNRMVWAMRTDAMTWSIFAPTRNAREYKPTIHTGEKQ